jgi:hypothetical protein
VSSTCCFASKSERRAISAAKACVAAAVWPTNSAHFWTEGSLYSHDCAAPSRRVAPGLAPAPGAHRESDGAALFHRSARATSAPLRRGGHASASAWPRPETVPKAAGPPSPGPQHDHRGGWPVASVAVTTKSVRPLPQFEHRNRRSETGGNAGATRSGYRMRRDSQMPPLTIATIASMISQATT